VTLYDLLVPAKALRWDRLHPMTTAPGLLAFEWEQQFYRDHPVLELGAFVALPAGFPDGEMWETQP
jgi:hypothetical protein